MKLIELMSGISIISTCVVFMLGHNVAALVLLIISIICWTINFSSQTNPDTIRKSVDDKITKTLSSESGFKTDVRFDSFDKNQIIAFDSSSKSICFIENKYKTSERIDRQFSDLKESDFNYESTVYRAKDIVEFEIIVNNETAIKSSRTSQLGGAVVGGVLFGGVGAIIGGVTGSKRMSEKTTDITIKIVFDDFMHPVRKICLLDEKSGIDKSSEKYKNSTEDAEHLHGLLSVYMNNKTVTN